MAVNAFTLFGEITVDTRKMQQALRDANKALRDTKKEMDALNSATGRTTTATNRAAQAEGNHTRALRASGNAARGKAKDMDQLGKKMGGVADKMQSFGTDMTYLVTAPILAAGAAALKTAVDFARLENQVNAAAGSFEAGAVQFKRLIDISRTSPGVFVKSAASAFALLKQMEGLTDPSIEKTIKAMGRIKLASPEFDATEFARNLNQLITQGFEAQDVKQAMGRLPAFGPMLAEKFKLSASDYTTVSKEMRKLVLEGKITGDDFMNAFGDAVLNHPIYSKLDDTLGDKFLKIWQDIELAIKPIGDRIGAILLPAFRALSGIIGQISQAFQMLSPELQTVALAMFGVVAAIGPVAGVVGTLVGIFGGLLILLAPVAAFFGVTLTAALGTFGAAIGIIVAALVGLVAQSYVVYQAYTTNFAGIGDAIDDVIRTVKEFYSTIVDELYAAVKPILDQLQTEWKQWGGIIQTVLKGAVILVTALIWALLKVIQGVVKVGGFFARIFGATVAKLIERVSDSLTMIMAALAAVARLIKGDFSGAAEAARTAFRLFIENVLALLGHFPAQVLGIIRSLSPKIDNFLDDLRTSLVQKAYDIGGEWGLAIMNGILNAVLGESGRVRDALNYLMPEPPKQLSLTDVPVYRGDKFSLLSASPHKKRKSFSGGDVGRGDGRQATKEVNAYQAELQKLNDEYNTFLANSDLFAYALQLQGDNFKKVTAEQKAHLIEVKRAQLAYEDYINTQTGTQKVINQLKDELFLLTTATEDERLAMEALGDLYFKVNPEIRAYVAELVKQKNGIDALNASVDQFVKNQETAEKELSDFIRVNEQAPTNLQKFEDWLKKVTAANHTFSQSEIDAARAAAIRADALVAQQDAFNRISTGMQALGMQTDSVKVKIQELMAALGNTAALQQMADALGTTVEDLRAKIEFEISEAQMPTFAGQWQKQLERMKESTQNFAADVAGTLANGMSQIGSVFGQAVAEWDGTAKGFFRSLAQGFRQLIQQIIQELIRLMVMRAVTSILAAVGQSAVNVPSHGDTSGPYSGAGGQEIGGPSDFAMGGLIRGAGTGTSDSILARVSNGEFVIPASSVKKFGVNFFESLRKGQMPMMSYAGGGMAMPSASSVNTSNSTANYNNVFNISVPAGGGSTTTATMVQDNVLKALRKHEKRNK